MNKLILALAIAALGNIFATSGGRGWGPPPAGGNSRPAPAAPNSNPSYSYTPRPSTPATKPVTPPEKTGCGHVACPVCWQKTFVQGKEIKERRTWLGLAFDLDENKKILRVVQPAGEKHGDGKVLWALGENAGVISFKFDKKGFTGNEFEALEH